MPTDRSLVLVKNEPKAHPIVAPITPMTGLDPRRRFKLKQRILKSRTDGQSLLVSAHELADLAEIADQIAIVDQGRLISLEKTNELGQGFPTLEAAFLAKIAANTNSDPVC